MTLFRSWAVQETESNDRFKFLNKLNGPQYAWEATGDDKPLTCHGMITDETVATRCLLWNCHFLFQDETNWNVSVKLPVPQHLKNEKTIRIMVAHVKAGQGSAYEFWESIGAPANLSNIEQEAIKAHAHPEYRGQMVEINGGFIDYSISLHSGEFALLEVGGDYSALNLKISKEGKKLNQNLEVDEISDN